MRRRFLIVSAVVIMLSGFATGQASAKTRRHQTIVTTKKVNKTKYHIKHENQKTVSKLSTVHKKRRVKIKQIKLPKKAKHQTLYATKKIRVKKPKGHTKWKYTTYLLLKYANGKKVGFVKEQNLVKGKYLTPDQRQLEKGYATGALRKKRLNAYKVTVNQMLSRYPQQVTKQAKIKDWQAIDKTVIFGDSIALGREYINGDARVADKPFIDTALQKVGVTGPITNRAYSGSGVFAYAKKSFPRNLAWQLAKHDISRYSVIFLSYGTNDWGLTKQGKKSLLQVSTELNHEIQVIRERAPEAKILAVLPIDRYDSKHNNLYADHNVGKQGYTLEELNDAFARVYKANGIPAFDWHKGQNAAITSYRDMSDGQTHPNNQGYAKMAAKLANWLEQQ